MKRFLSMLATGALALGLSTSASAQYTRAVGAGALTLDDHQSPPNKLTIETPQNPSAEWTAWQAGGFQNLWILPVPPSAGAQAGFIYSGPLTGAVVPHLAYWLPPGQSSIDGNGNIGGFTGAWDYATEAELGLVSGTGSPNVIPKWNGAGTALTNSAFTDNGTNVSSTEPVIVTSDNVGAASGDADQVLIQGSSNNNQQLEIGYNTTGNASYTNGFGTIQAIDQGVTGTPVFMNVAGGPVAIDYNPVTYTGTLPAALNVNGDVALSYGAARTIFNPDATGSDITGYDLTVRAASAQFQGTASAGGNLNLTGGNTNSAGSQAGGSIILTAGRNYWNNGVNPGALHGDIIFRGGRANQTTNIYEDMRINGTTGFVGIGTASATVELDVNGSTRIRSLSTAGVVHNDASGNLTTALVNLTSEVTGVLPIANGGTNTDGTSYATDGSFYFDGTELATTSPGDLHTVLHGNGLAAPSFSSVDLTADVTGILPAVNGGTGLDGSAAANGQLLIGNGTGFTLNTITQNSANQVIVTNAAGSITLSTPQDIATTSSPTFADLTLNNDLNMPATTGSTVGVINAGGTRWMFNYPNGNSNEFFGLNSGNFTMTTANSDLGVGPNVLQSLSVGQQNTGVGAYALVHADGNNNTGTGYNSLNTLTSGSDNTAVGNYSGYTINGGSQNTFLGSSADASGDYSNATAIGYGASVGASNTIQLGNSSVTLVNTSGAVNTATGYQVGGLAASGSYLRGNGTDFVSSALMAGDLSGIVAIANGGTNSSAALTANSIMVADGTGSSIISGNVNATATNEFLTQSSSGVPAWNTIQVADLPTGTVSGSGTINTIPIFTATGSTIGNSGITETGGIIQSNDAINLGDATHQGILRLNNGSGSQVTIAPNGANILDVNNNFQADGNINANSATGVYQINGATVLRTPIASALFAGQGAGNATVSGIDNTGIGYGSLGPISSGSGNTGVGAWTLATVSTGSANIAIGEYAYMSGNGNDNTIVGEYAAQSSTGSSNTAVGKSALGPNTGSQNVAIGWNALSSPGSGGAGDNVAVGLQSLDNNTSGANNTAIGFLSGFGNSSGSGNTSVGNFTGFSNATGSNVTLVGNSANVGSDGLTNATALGNGSTVTASNEIQLGNGSVTLVNTSGAINTPTGYRVSGAAASGNYLRGNGTNFVSSAIQAGDIPSLSGTYVVLAPSTNQTIQPTAATVVPLTIEGAAGQTADLFDVENSTPAKVLSVDPTGLLTVSPRGNSFNEGISIAPSAADNYSEIYFQSQVAGNAWYIGHEPTHNTDGDFIIGRETLTGMVGTSGIDRMLEINAADGSASFGGKVGIGVGTAFNPPTLTALLSVGGTTGDLTVDASGTLSTTGNISTTGTGTITSAGLLTASSGVTVTTGQTILSYNSGASASPGPDVIPNGTSVYALTAGAAANYTITMPTGVNGEMLFISNLNGGGWSITAPVGIPDGSTAEFVYSGGAWQLIHVGP